MKSPGFDLRIAAFVCFALVLQRSITYFERLNELAEQLDRDETLTAHGLDPIRHHLLRMMLHSVHLSMRSHGLRLLLYEFVLSCRKLTIIKLHEGRTLHRHVVRRHLGHGLRVQQLLLHFLSGGSRQACLCGQTVQWVYV